jgi:class IV lanthipeptide synthase
MCHGLAGDGELLLDVAAAAGEPQYADAAWSIAAQLWDLRVRRDGRWLVPDESRTGTGVDYGVGTSGAAAFLLRLLHGGRRPRTADDVPYGPRAAGFPAFDGENEGR